MKTLKNFLVFIMAFVFAACSNEDFVNYKDVGVKSFSSFTATIEETADTRVYLGDAAQEGKKRVYWNVGDKIFITSDTEKYFKTYTVKSIINDQKVVFDGEMISGNTFYAYYQNIDSYFCFDYNSVSFEAYIPNIMFYEGDEIHIPMVAVSNSNNLTFKQVAGMIHFSIGGIDKLESVYLKGNNNEYLYGYGFIDLKSEKPEFQLISSDYESRFFDGNILKDDLIILGDSIVDIYYYLPPMTFEKGFTLMIKGYDEYGNPISYNKMTTTNQIVKRGEINHYKVVNVQDELDDLNERHIINFKDYNVKTICINYFDTDGDGELSYEEASAVSVIPTINVDNINYSIFSNINNLDDGTHLIEWFDELKFFTSLKSIPQNMFCGQPYLISVTLPDNIISIEDNAFTNCERLKNITLPNGLKSIGKKAFYYCSSLKKIDIPIGVSVIDENTFSYCYNLSEVNIPYGVTSIEQFAFHYCGFSEIKLPTSLTKLGDCAIADCKNLTYINIPNSVKDFAMSVFSGCTNLKNIKLPNKVTVISGYLFSRCSSLEKIDIPSSVTLIGGFAFDACTGLKEVSFSGNEEEIGFAAFQDCKSLTNVDIPNSVTSIIANSFSGCSNLTHIKIGNNVEVIGYYAFACCSSLTKIILPISVQKIGEGAFKDCYNLKSLYVMNEYPPELLKYDAYNVSIRIPKTCIVFVPKGSLDRYKENDQWKQYADQIQAIPE